MSSCVKVFEDALPGPQALLHHLVCQIVLAGVGEPLPRVILVCLENEDSDPSTGNNDFDSSTRWATAG